MCFDSQSPDHHVFLKVTFVCNGVSGNGNASAQVARREPKKCTRFAIGLIQQLPHLSNLLLWAGLSKCVSTTNGNGDESVGVT